MPAGFNAEAAGLFFQEVVVVNLSPYPYPAPESRLNVLRDTAGLVFSKPGDWHDQQSLHKAMAANVDELVRRPKENNNVR